MPYSSVSGAEMEAPRSDTRSIRVFGRLSIMEVMW